MASVKGLSIVADTSVPGSNIRLLYGSKTHDWADMLGTPLGANTHGSTTVTVTGAKLGDVAIPFMSVSTLGMCMSAAVTAADTVTVSAVNATAASINIASGTLSVLVIRLNA